MKKDQKTLLYEVLSKTAAMTGDGFIGISESTRRKVAKGLIYEDVSLEDFDLIRDFVLHEAAWDHTKFTTKEEINAEIARLQDAKRADLPSIAYENIDNHLQTLRDKLMEFGDGTINEGLVKFIKKILNKKKKKTIEDELEDEKNKITARRNLFGVTEEVTFEDVCDVMLESVLDPINKIRCPEIFDKNDVMRPKVRSFINNMVDKFKEHVNFPLNIRNIYMIGSSTGYQYSLTSDIDIEIELGIEAKQKWDIIPIVPKGTFLPGTQKPLNIFILCKDETYDFDKAENVYDIINNKWLKKTDKKDLEIPYQYIRDLASFFMNGCDLSISNYEKDIRELDEYIALDPEKQEISVKEKFEAIDRKLIDVKNDVDQMKMAHHVIFAFENEGYEGNPFKISIQGIDDPDPRYSINNLVYKMLDKHGYNDKMKDIVKYGSAKVKEVEKYISENKDKTLQEARRDTAPNHCRGCGCPTDPGEYICDDCRKKEEAERKKKEIEAHDKKAASANQVTKRRDQNPGQLEFTFESAITEDKEYTKYIKGHIKNLKSGFRWMKKYIPEIFPNGYFNKENRNIRKAIRTHDKSKWDKEEYKAYSDFQHVRSMNLTDKEYDAKKNEFNAAWNHHQKGNKHHWQYWILTNADGSTKVLDMPYENIIEMICDWWTFSWKENNLHAIFDWYEKNKGKMVLSPKTKSTVENILNKMKAKIKELEKENKLEESIMIITEAADETIFDNLTESLFLEFMGEFKDRQHIKSISDKLYVCLPIKYDSYISVKNTQNTPTLWVTPYIGMASLYAIRSKDCDHIFRSLGKWNLGFREYGKIAKTSKIPLKNIHVYFRNNPNFKDIVIKDAKSYIYEIDAKKYKDNIFRFSFMDPNQNNEYVILDLDKIEFIKRTEIRSNIYFSSGEDDLYESVNILESSNRLTTKKEDLPDVQTGEAFKVTFYDNGKYIGEASVSDDYDGDKLCFIYNVEVKKELRGQGYGTKIMKYMIEKYHVKSLQVEQDNNVAIHLYKKLGFRETGKVRVNKNRVDIRMELPNKKRLEEYND